MKWVMYYEFYYCLFRKKQISSFFYYSMNSQGKRIVVLDLTAFPFLQTLNKENTVDYMFMALFL